MPDVPTDRRPRTRRLAAAVLVLAGALLAAPAAHAAGLQVLDQRQLTPRLLDYTMRTEALKAPVHTRILLPAGYTEHPKRRYPVLWLLHGGYGGVADWTTQGDAEAITASAPMIVVMPEDGNGGWYADWFNGGRGGPPRWETFHLGQLLPWVDAHLRTIADRGHRAIAGLSTGGYGAMHDAARHPDLFSFAASFSGAVDVVGNPLVPAVIAGEALADGGGPDDVFGNRVVDELRWRAGNPNDLAANLRGLRLQVRTGNGTPGPLDPPGRFPDPIEQQVHEMSSAFDATLDRLAIGHTWVDYGPGTHSWPYWQRDLRETLPAMLASFADPPRAPRRVTFTSADRRFDVYGWRVTVRRVRTRGFATLRRAGAHGFRFAGPDGATVRTPRRYRPRSHHAVTVNGVRTVRRAGRRGRLSVPVPPAATVKIGHRIPPHRKVRHR